MAYVQKHLRDGETIVHQSKKHWFIYFWPLFVMFNGMMLGASVPNTDVISVLIFLLGFLWLIGEWVIAMSSEFAVTSHRLIMKSGLFSRRLVELNLNQVTGVSSDVGIVGRALKFGNLNVKATSGVSYGFNRLRDPEKFTALVQQQTAAMSGNQAAPGNSAPPVDVATGLEKLAKLRADGVLTDAEFEAQKAKLLS